MQAEYITDTPRLDTGNPEAKRREILAYFLKTYEQYEKLFELPADDTVYYDQPNPQRHPLIFYFGHTAVFFINKLVIAKVLDTRIDQEFESLFAIGVDEMEWDDLERSHYNWPDVEAVREYRKKVKEVVIETIEMMPLNIPIGWEDPAWVILMGIEHERIHLETSSVLLRELPLDRVREHPLWPLCPDAGETPANVLQAVPGGEVRHNLSVKNPRYYGWDNEFGTKESSVAPFKASRYMVSNGEFLEFVKAGGYQEAGWWSDEGWEWVSSHGVWAPRFWVPAQEGYRYRAMTAEISMPLDWPVDVNYLEAKAYCNWLSEKEGKTLRLPTEEEWYRLREHCGIREEPPFTKKDGNLALRQYASPTPVTANPHGEFYDVIGNVWQWTETHMNPYEGFETHPVYDDFTVPTFDEKHNMIKGGSWISTGNEVLKSARFAFRRHFHQHAGFRYVEGEAEQEEHVDIYERDELISQYCEFHYGEEYFGVRNFPKAVAEYAIGKMEGRPMEIALDIGCAVGRSSFELSKAFKKVEGLDFSTRFIRHAVDLKEKGRVSYRLKEEGEITIPVTRTLNSLKIEGGNVHFWQGDACNLKPNFTGYDLVLAVNLIDRLYDPALFLSTIHERLNRGGLLILGSPYTWQEESTPRAKWVGGYLDGEHPVYTLEGLELLLGSHFRLIDGPESIEFVIRETKRKYQHSLSEFTVWEKQ